MKKNLIVTLIISTWLNSICHSNVVFDYSPIGKVESLYCLPGLNLIIISKEQNYGLYRIDLNSTDFPWNNNYPNKVVGVTNPTTDFNPIMLRLNEYDINAVSYSEKTLSVELFSSKSILYTKPVDGFFDPSSLATSIYGTLMLSENSYNQSIEIHDIVTGELVRAFITDGSDFSVYNEFLAISPNGGFGLLIDNPSQNANCEITSLNIVDGTHQRIIINNRKSYSAKYSPSSQYLAIENFISTDSLSYSLKIADPLMLTTIRDFTVGQYFMHINDYEFTPDGNKIAVLDNDKIVLIDIIDLTTTSLPLPEGEMPKLLTFSPDGSRIFVVMQSEKIHQFYRTPSP